MACLPGWLFISCGLFVVQLRITLGEQFLLNVTGNCSEVPWNGVYYLPFRVWSTKKRNETFNCIQYTTNCSDAEMPDHLKDPINFMGKPHSLDGRPYLRDVGGVSYPGINITWTPMKQAAGIEGLKGFLVRVFPIVGNGMDKCRIFDFSKNNFTAGDEELTFNKEIFPVKSSNNDVYMVTVFSLPWPKRGQRLIVSMFQFLKPQPRRKGSGTAVDWAAPLTFDNSTFGEVNVGFGFAPNEFGFEKYRLEMVEHDAKNVYKQTIITQAELKDNTWAFWKFTRIPSGLWRIRVQPVDPYFNDNRKCLCYRGYTLQPYKKRNCEQCLITETLEFITGEGTTTTVTTTPKAETTPGRKTPAKVLTTMNSSLPASVKQPQTGTDSTAKIVGSVLGTIVGVLLVMVILFFVWRKRKTGDDQTSEKTPNNNNDPFYENTGIFTLTSDLSRMTVFIVCAEDHTYHNTVVEQFAIYLQTYCKCDVIYAPWYVNEIRSLGNGNLWTITNINKSDYTIIINSQAAFNLFEAVKDQDQRTMYKNTDAGPAGDLFSPAIIHIMSKLRHPDLFPKFIMAYFEYTGDHHIISEIDLGHRYKLPKHMSHLLCHIHKVDTKDMAANLNEKDLPFRDTIADTDEGKDLEDAIRQTIEYEKRNPFWFKDRYIRMDSGFHSTGPDEVQSPNEYDCVTQCTLSDAPPQTNGNDHIGYRYEFYEDDCLEPPQSIRHFDNLSLTLSDQLREVNKNAENVENGFVALIEFIPPDCESIGGMSV